MTNFTFSEGDLTFTLTPPEPDGDGTWLLSVTDLSSYDYVDVELSPETLDNLVADLTNWHHNEPE